MVYAPLWPEAEVTGEALTGFTVVVAVQKLGIHYPAVIRREEMGVQSVDCGVFVRVIEHGTHPAELATAATTGVFVQCPAHHEVAAGGLDADDSAIVESALNLWIVFGGKQDAVAEVTELPGKLARAEQIGRLTKIRGNNAHACRYIVAGGTADAARIENLYRPTGTTTATGARRGVVEDVLAFEEEDAAFGEELFEGREVYNDIIGFHGTEVGVDGCRQQGVCRGTPINVSAHTWIVVVLDAVEYIGDKREVSELATRFDVGELELHVGREEFVHGAW